MRRSLTSVLTLAVAVAACGTPTPSPSATPASGSPQPPSSAPASASPSAPSLAPGAAPAVSVTPVFDGLDSPVDLAYRPNDPSSLFVVEQSGRIQIVRGGKLLARPFLDIRDLVRAGGEQGLLGLAFLPSAEKGRFFVYYTDRDGGQVVASYDTTGADADRADPSTARIWLTMDDPFANHNGGSLAFGPDGMLYIGTGDGGGGGDPLDSGRHLDTLLAKLLRIDVSKDQGAGSPTAYRIPPDNPFVKKAGARPEIFATGLRNPWRIRFDRANGDLWIGDVGQGDWEEIDVIRAGTSGFDFGWNTLEGTHCFGGAQAPCATPDLTMPVAEYGHDQASCSVTGGAVYRGSAFQALQGWYVFSDYCSGTFWAIEAAKASSDHTIDPPIVATTSYSISAIAEDSSGELYATDLSAGALLRIGLAGS